MEYGPAEEWSHSVQREPWLLDRTLGDWQLDAAAASRFRQECAEASAGGGPPDEVARRLNDVLARRRLEVVEQWTDEVEVPLYRFCGPPVKRARVIYHDQVVEIHEKRWELTVFGIGTGRTRRLPVGNAFRLEASGSQCKEVFAPVPMLVERVVILEGGKRVGEGRKGEVLADRRDSEVILTRRGCRNLPMEKCTEQPDPLGHELLDLRLAGTRRSEMHSASRSWETDLTTDLSLRFKQKIEFGPAVRVTRMRSLKLDFEVPGGSDYLCRLAPGRLWWEKPER